MTVWLHRALVAGLAVCWIVVMHSGVKIFRQKQRPHFEALPGLVGEHVNLGVFWAILLAITWGLIALTGPDTPLGALGFLAAVALGITFPLVLWTGHGLKTGKPRGAFVHVFYALVATTAALVLVLEHLWNLLF